MNVKRLCLKEVIGKDTKDAISVQLSRKYTSLAAELKKRYSSQFSLKDIDGFIDKRADLFLLDEANYGFYYFSDAYDYLEIGSFSQKDAPSGKFDEFKDEVQKIIYSKTQNKVSFDGIEESPNFKYIKEEMNDFLLEQDKVRIAKHLNDDLTRSILHKIGSGAWREEFNHVDAEKLEAILNALEEFNLIKREYVVFCTETKAQIIRVSSYNIIEESQRRGFKCFSCGRMLDEEKVSQFITLTQLGQLFSKKNLWVVYIVAAYFYEHLKRDLKIFFKEEIENASIDLIINYQSKLILLQIKEDEVNLADIYYFLSKKQFYNIDYGCIFSLNAYSSAVKYFLEGKNEEGILFYASWDDFYENIHLVLERACSSNISDIINIFSGCTKVDVKNYVEEFLKELPLQKEREKTALLGEPIQEEELIGKPQKILADFEIAPLEDHIEGVSDQETPAPGVYGESVEFHKKTVNAVRSAKNDIAKLGILGAEENLRNIIKAASLSCAVLELNTGYVIYDFTENPAGLDLTAPYFCEIFSRAKDIAQQAGFRDIEHIYFGMEEEAVSVYNGLEYAILVQVGKDLKLVPDISFEAFNTMSSFAGIEGAFSINYAGDLISDELKSSFNINTAMDFVFKLYGMAKPFIEKIGMSGINKIVAEVENYKFIIFPGREKIDVLVASGGFEMYKLYV